MDIDAKAWGVIERLRGPWCDSPCNYREGCGCADDIAAALLAVRNEEREKLAKWMLANFFATGHGDSMEDLLNELTWQAAEARQKSIAVHNETLEEAAQLLLKEAKDLNDGPGYYGEEIQDYERLADALRDLKTTTG